MQLRVTAANSAPERPGDYVLYWMIAARRVRSNFALERACALAREHRKPLVIFEPLRVGYAHASDRLHQFVLDGMADNRDFGEATANASATPINASHTSKQ